MTNKLITELSVESFDALIDAYIERETRDTGELPAPLFYQALREVFRAEQGEPFLTMETTIAGNRLILSAPPRTVLPDNIREVEVNLPGVRVVVSRDPLAA